MRKLLISFCLLFAALLTNSATADRIDDKVSPSFDLSKRDESVAINGCPNLDFNWHMSQENILHYDMDVTSVSWVKDNTYQITIHVKAVKDIPLKYLWSLKIIGVNGPSSTVQLYGKNEKTYLISDPTDFTSTFQVYAYPSSDGCTVWMPNFQIQFEYLQGDAAQYWQTWQWGTTTFDLSTGCNNYDNQGHSQTDFPGFYWTYQCKGNNDGTCTKASSSSITTSSSTTSSSTTSSSTTSSSTTSSSTKTSTTTSSTVKSSSTTSIDVTTSVDSHTSSSVADIYRSRTSTDVTTLAASTSLFSSFTSSDSSSSSDVTSSTIQTTSVDPTTSVVSSSSEDPTSSSAVTTSTVQTTSAGPNNNIGNSTLANSTTFAVSSTSIDPTSSSDVITSTVQTILLLQQV
ncbi:CGH_1_HP_G0106810.mRNA.1.CDS.1 [Saccharomyces cerevisiae]|nr:CGH_1_HP_G0073460.mRNA.1.CDS.1 [Saccharomyces cerevisiae]CAI5037485.1 CGH_1_HP_G0106810.mRNA.1.CDS.1 [Saccharomyces cerevisiae]CAI6899146.1 CGH_1_HP_G0073460.mRNA.1.CDS.1 [Saccharomyces cerevisiae]CAI6954383.1 CGH_1_HP_G0106810.mRNA.1.CDS.1 [Saccharomyces cerevisiae]